MKRYLSSVLFSLCSLALFANGVEINGIYYLLNATGQTATVTYTTDSDPTQSNPSAYTGKITIPEIVNYENVTYTVNTIGQKAFFYSRMDSLFLPQTIATIENAAFYRSRGIYELNLPNLTTIGNEAFRYCGTITRVVLPEGVSVGRTTFQRCLSLKEIHFPNSMTSLPYACLYACTSLEHVDLPPLLTSIPSECFTACLSLKSISIPETVKSINYWAFRGCIALEKFYIPKNVTTLGDEIICGNPLDPDTGDCFKVDGVRQTGDMSKMKSVFIDRETPPQCSSTAFLRVIKSNVRLFVPENSVETYKSQSQYADYFNGIYGFGAGVVNVMNITTSSALITWFPVENVVLYTISISTGGNAVAEYKVDGNGHIVASQQFAQTIHKMRMDTTNSSTDYYVLTLDDLEAGTEYNYSIDGTDANNAPVYHEEGSFMTKTTDGIEPVVTDDKKKVRKIFRDGQIFILRENKTYTIMGLSL